ELSDKAINRPDDLLSREMLLEHPPAQHVFVLWQHHLYGPLETKDCKSTPGEQVCVQFSEMKWSQDGLPELEKLAVMDSSVIQQADRYRHRAAISLNDRALYMDNSQKRMRSFLLVPWQNLEVDLRKSKPIAISKQQKGSRPSVDHVVLIQTPSGKPRQGVP